MNQDRVGDAAGARVPSADELKAAALAKLSASERLALSREEMRVAMLPASATRQRVGAARPLDPRTADWRDRLHAIPGAGLVLDVVESWWRRHPMRTAAVVTAQASHALVGPLAKRNPIRLVLVAFVVGAILSKVKPWRWLRRTLFAGLLPQIALRVATELPVQRWIEKLNQRP